MGTRYLHGYYFKEFVEAGKSIEQFLGPSITKNNEQIVRYCSIRKHENEYWTHLHELFDQGDSEHLDVYSFEYTNLPESRWEPIPVKFDSLEKALSFATHSYGASEKYWVGPGMVQDEYGDFKSGLSRYNT